ncbi:MAG: response regulator [Nitrospirae bacterium]|nr:response regulator [Nitrospirota bacterium]
MLNERKVLVVDDDRLICWSLEKALKKDGCEVSVARTGEEARERLERDDFDLVITDLKMPGMDGMEVLEEVRRHCPSARSVLMTAFGSGEISLQAEKYGASYIAKPFQIKEFVNDIRRLFNP